jgi:hypothetical protein
VLSSPVVCRHYNLKACKKDGKRKKVAMQCKEHETTDTFFLLFLATFLNNRYFSNLFYHIMLPIFGKEALLQGKLHTPF